MKNKSFFEIIQKQEPLKESEILEFEKKLNLELPKDYKAFIRDYNGLDVENNFYFQIKGKHEEKLFLGKFIELSLILIIMEKGKDDFWVNTLKNYNLIPISTATYSHYHICLSTSKKSKGAIYYLKTDIEPIFLAKNFESFIKNCKYIYPTSFEEAMKNNDYIEIEKCIREGIDLNSIDIMNEQSFFELAISTGALNVIKALSDRKVPKEGLLYLTAKLSNVTDCSDALEYLISIGCNIDEQDERGYTTLMYSLSSTEQVKLLLEKGADFKIKNNQGNKAIDIIKLAIEKNNGSPLYKERLKENYKLLQDAEKTKNNK